ncbi:MAG TPA: multicopper oxidase domain-containing protein, partial [Terriglobales bacterium]|nr:multicopper oxidase domain-containing protein [Terriglobales bacterium]
TLSLQLEIVEGMWYPDGYDSTGVLIPVFAEPGKPPTDPGPLLRVREGTTIDVSIRNRIAGKTATVHGLHTRPGKDQPVEVPFGEERHVRFSAGAPGAYFYWASVGGKSLQERDIDSELSGAFIVDPPGKPAKDPIFIISAYDRPPDPKATPPVQELDTFAINGRSWPHTQHFTHTVGEPIHWTWINASYEPHPLHLHGTYFSVDSLGDNERDRIFPPSERRLVVTESLADNGTMRMTWSPEQPGNWLFHCHILYHVTPYLDLSSQIAYPKYEDFVAAHDHSHKHMAGLVLGVTALPRPGARAAVKPAPRLLTLVAAPRGDKLGDLPALGYQLFAGDVDPAPGTLRVVAPGVPIVLTRGQPVAIKVVNRLQDSTSVHWHGIQLESYFDGVVGWGGLAPQVTPAIAPGDSFVAHFTPPRSGTFIYHTHLNDLEQISTGLYGALIVVDHHESFDPDSDKVFVLSRGGIDDEKAPVLINGVVQAAPLSLRAGKRYRLRFVGITAAATVTVSLKSGDSVATWRPLAKDGADLPASYTAPKPATVALDPGETYDFEYVPAAPGQFVLEASIRKGKLLATVPFQVAP